MVCCGDPSIVSTSSTTTTPPPGSNCCLRVKYDCECSGGTPSWALDAGETACVDNGLCVGGSSCSDTEYVNEIIDGCVCAAALPVLPTPSCDPDCCTTTTTTTTPPPETTTTTPPPPPTTTTTAPPSECCVWIFQSVYDCVTDTWGAPSLNGSTPDVPCAANVDWTLSTPCIAIKTMYTAGGACAVAPSPGTPGISPGPECCPTTTTTTPPPPTAYCNTTYEAFWNCTTSEWDAPTPVADNCGGLATAGNTWVILDPVGAPCRAFIEMTTFEVCPGGSGDCDFGSIGSPPSIGALSPGEDCCPGAPLSCGLGSESTCYTGWQVSNTECPGASMAGRAPFGYVCADNPGDLPQAPDTWILQGGTDWIYYKDEGACAPERAVYPPPPPC